MSQMQIPLLEPTEGLFPHGKRCPKCGKRKPVEQFGRDKQTKSGVSAYCLECKRIKAARRRYANLEDSPYRPYNPDNRHKGAERIDDGYIFVNCGPNNWGAKHRLVMEACLKRPLKTSEQVHHINEDKLDNRKENLFIFNIQDHSGVHFNTRRELAKTQWQLRWARLEIKKSDRQIRRLHREVKRLSQHALEIYRLQKGG